MTRKKKTRYRAASGCPYTHMDAQIIGDELSRIREIYDGEIRPQDVLEESKDINSPIHDYFDWDDKSAANKWRIDQARRMIRYVLVIIQTDDGPKETRAMVSVSSEEVRGKRYVSIAKAMSNDNYRAQMISEALRKAHSWKENYKKLKELKPIFEVIDKFKIKEKAK